MGASVLIPEGDMDDASVSDRPFRRQKSEGRRQKAEVGVESDRQRHCAIAQSLIRSLLQYNGQFLRQRSPTSQNAIALE